MDDGLPSHRDFLGRIEFDKRQIDILLQRVPRDDGVYIWKFSSASVRHIPGLYQQFGYGPVGERLSRALPSYELLGLQLWQWVFLLGLGIAAYFVVFLPTWGLSLLLRRKGGALSQELARFVNGPLRLLIMILLLREWIDVIHPSVATRALMRGQTLLLIAATWAAMRIIDLLRRYVAERLRYSQREQAIVLLRPSANAIKTLLILIASMVWLDNIGFKVTTLLAGLGIGGLAIALAAQKSIENLIGAITLYMAAPVHVGNFCRFGDKLGTVEEIGLRSTRIRTLDKTVITVPNAEFANMQLENFADRDSYLFNSHIHLRYGTHPDQLRYILVELQKLLYAHPKVNPPPARARFVGFGTHSLDIEIYTYIRAADYSDYLEVAEDLNLYIMDIVKAAGSDFALPAQNVYLNKGKPLDEGYAQAAESQVAQWRDSHELHLPNLPQEKIEQIKGSLPYPRQNGPKSDAS